VVVVVVVVVTKHCQSHDEYARSTQRRSHAVSQQ
jgi:hypothetical protein